MANLPTSRLYTGQEKSYSSGLYFYNARWYDSDLSRFTSPDSIIPNPYNPLTVDRYSYAQNNPIRFNDPTGHDVGCGGVDCMDYGVKKNGYPIYLGEIKLKGPYDRENSMNLSAIAEEGYTGFSTSGDGPRIKGPSYVGIPDLINQGLVFARDNTPARKIGSEESVIATAYVKFSEDGISISGLAITNHTVNTFVPGSYTVSRNGTSVIKQNNSVGRTLGPTNIGLARPGETGIIPIQTIPSKSTPFTINIGIYSVNSPLFYFGQISHDVVLR